MPNKSNPVGPVGQRVAENVKLRRQVVFGSRSKAEMSRRLAELGRPMSIDVITKIEVGRRPVDADDIVALSLVLGVSPNRLMFSVMLGGDVDQEIALTERLAVPTGDALNWARDGAGPPPAGAQLPGTMIEEIIRDRLASQAANDGR